MTVNIQSLWVGTTLSRIEQLSIKSFLAHGHSYHLYCYSSLSGVPAGVTVHDASEILEQDLVFASHGGSYAMFADMFRYKLLYERGGYWVDTDIVCLQPFDFPHEHLIATEREPDGSVQPTNCVLKAPRGSSFMHRCYETCRDQDIAHLPWGATGPGLVKQLVPEFALTPALVAPHVFCPAPWFDLNVICSTGYTVKQFRNSHAIHLWLNRWQQEGKSPNQVHSDSLFEQLWQMFNNTSS